MKTPKNPKSQIVQGAIAHLDAQGPPYASYANIADAANLSRQLMRYYYPEPDILMLEVCDTLAEAYRSALSESSAQFDGSAKLDYILDFYFGLTDQPAGHSGYGCADALTAHAAGHEKLKSAMREKYTLMGQALQLEIKVAYPDLTLRACAELAYLCLCILQGNRKLSGSLGMDKAHSQIARKSIDRMIKSFQSNPVAMSDGFDVWS